MDAKPQRPTRGVRVYGDENVVPTVGVPKTLHQRNKSSPALSSMLHAGGLKAAAKRTAFGDVSNTTNISRPSKDDSAIGGKVGYNLVEKSVGLQPDKKTTSLSRPAQRPISVSGLKNLLNNVTSSNNQVAIKQPLAEIPELAQPRSQIANIRKAFTKRSTTIFKDLPQTQSDQKAPSIDSRSSTTAALDLINHKSEHTQENKSLKDQEFCNKVRRTKSYVVETKAREENTEISSTSQASEDVPVVRSDGVFIDNNGDIQIYQYPSESDPEQDPPQAIANEASPVLPVEIKTKVEVVALSKISDEQPEVSLPEPAEHHKFAPVSEPEEYWDEEEEDGNYDEDGYVTARSYKSRGENTTNGATTILFPKMNQKVKRELAAAKDLMEGARIAEELDDESWDTTMVAEYGDEIFEYMKDLEIKMLPNAHYMDNQAEIQWSMRSVLMDWLVQVHHRFSLLPETLFLCVNYIDRFLSCKVVSLGKLQLVGATAIFVAAKYEEINCPSVQEIVYMVDNGYTVDEILKAERFMLSMLQFELGWPGPMSFLRRISKADDYDLETRTLAKYFLEVTIMDERFIGSPPSFAAAGAHCLARMMLKKGNWSLAHVYYSNYTYSQLFMLVALIVECCENPEKHHKAIFDKYTDKRFKRASFFVQNEMKKGFRILDVAANSSVGATYIDPYDNKQISSYK